MKKYVSGKLNFRVEYIIIDLFVNRYDDLLNTIEELSFKKIDARLKAYLKKHSVILEK